MCEACFSLTTCNYCGRTVSEKDLALDKLSSTAGVDKRVRVCQKCFELKKHVADMGQGITMTPCPTCNTANNPEDLVYERDNVYCPHCVPRKCKACPRKVSPVYGDLCHTCKSKADSGICVVCSEFKPRELDYDGACFTCRLPSDNL